MASPIILPDLFFFEPKKYRVGTTQQLLSLGGEVGGKSIQKVAVSARSTADCFVLDKGEKIIVTKKTKLTLPKNVDGVLRLHSDGNHTWLAHKKLDYARKEVAKLGLKNFEGSTDGAGCGSNLY